ncbi:hypothetical protein ADL00_38495 [Streptomyces sp. AS58]|uniref:hypothetical protein n=1 Tax=Streptomyces sp. AS58 TaxID=1519489 RepID=UPI0006AECAAB|nr:hypothetical protein [Streptomyces sp. AS58]KOV52056.1 hypothetical protein ADL00_38495 [Streptomyces sp. AS58]
MLKHPVVRECVDALVDGRGGLVVYGQGLGGRETLVAAAAGIAATTGKTLTVVDAELLREATAALVTDLGLAEHTFLSPTQAVSWPTGFDPDGVLAVHGDVLRNQDLVQPLRAAARHASLHGHLVVARHPYGSDRLDSYTSQFRQIAAADFMPAPGVEEDSTSPDTPGPVAKRVQSPSWQAGQDGEPTWIPLAADHRAERLARERVAQDEPVNLTTAPPGGISEEVLERGRSFRAAWRQLGGTQPDAQGASPASAQQDSDRVFRVTREGSAGSPDVWADLEAKRQFLAGIPGALRTVSVPDPQRGTPPQDSEARQGMDDSLDPSAPQPDPDERTAADRHGLAERRQRAMNPITSASPAGEGPAVSYEEFRAPVEDPEALQAAQRRIAEVQATTRLRLEQSDAALATPLPDRPDTSRADRSRNDAAQRDVHVPPAPPSPGPRP